MSVNGMASVKLPARSRATAYVSIGQLKDAGDPLMPQTINSANADRCPSSATRQRRGAHHGGQSQVRVAAHAVHGPERALSDLRLRQPHAGVHHDAARVVRQRAVGRDAARCTPSHSACCAIRWTRTSSVGAELCHRRHRLSRGSQEERTHRIFESTTDNVVRVTFDSVGNALVLAANQVRARATARRRASKRASSSWRRSASSLACGISTSRRATAIA